MKIAIVGAGAVGCWLGSRLAAAGHTISVLARGATLNSLARDGICLTEEGKTRHFPVLAGGNPASLGTQDIVFVAVKAPAMATVAPAVRAMLTKDSIVVPAMNGVPWWFAEGLDGAAPPVQAVVDPDGTIGGAIPREQVIGCVVYASISSAGPGHAVRNTGNRLILGEPLGGESDRVSRIVTVCRESGLDADASKAIRQDIWYKLWGNMTMNPVSAITGATTDRIIDEPNVRNLVMAVMAEAAEVGARIGCPIAEPVENRIQVTRRHGAIRTSMLQDVEAKRLIELETLLGAPRAIARTLGLPTPNMDMLYGLTRLFAQTHGLLP